MTAVRRYCVWCNTESAKVCTWASSTPTECPNDSGHSIDTSKTVIEETRDQVHILVDPTIEPVAPGASQVVANDRPAIEIQTDTTGYGAMQLIWPHEQNDEALLALRVRFIVKESGTGTVVRMSARVKAQGEGDDSSESWADTASLDVTVNHTNIGDVFSALLVLDADSCGEGDAVALQVGREGAHANDTVSEAIQIIGIEGVAL